MNNMYRYPRTRLEAFPLHPDDTYHRGPTTPPWVRVVGRLAAIVAISLAVSVVVAGVAFQFVRGL